MQLYLLTLGVSKSEVPKSRKSTLSPITLRDFAIFTSLCPVPCHQYSRYVEQRSTKILIFHFQGDQQLWTSPNLTAGAISRTESSWCLILNSLPLIPSGPRINEMSKWFSSLGFHEPRFQNSRFQITVSLRFWILKCWNAKTLLQRYFTFRDFGASDVEHSTPCQ